MSLENFVSDPLCVFDDEFGKRDNDEVNRLSCDFKSLKPEKHYLKEFIKAL